MGKRQETDQAVLFISPLPPPDGGVQSWTASILKNGLPGDYVPDVVDTRLRGERRNWALKRLSLSEVHRTVSILTDLLVKLVTGRPRIVHLNCCLSPVGIYRDLVCAVIARLFGKPLVTHYHADFAAFPAGSHHGLSRKCLRWLANISQLNIALNNESCAGLNALLSPGKAPALVLPNFIDECCRGYKAEPGARKPRCRVIYVGRISVAKGCREIMEVAARLPDADFILIGIVLADMEAAVRSKPANVQLLGAMPRAGVLAELSRSDIFFFPSHTEGFPVAVLEAMTVGLPVVATRVGAIPQMIEEGRGGLLAECQAVDDLYQAVAALADDAQRRGQMGTFNRDFSRRLYDYAAVTGQLAGHYNRLLAGDFGVKTQ